MSQTPPPTLASALPRRGPIDLLARASGFATLAVAIIAVVLSVARTIHVVESSNDMLEMAGGVLLWGAGWVLTWPTFGAVGALVLWQQPRNTLGWICLGLGFATCLRAALWLGAGFALNSPYRAVIMLALGETVGLCALPGLLTVLLLMFPTGAPPSAGWRPVLWIAMASAAISMLGVFRQDTLWPYDTVALANPLYLAWLHDLMPKPGQEDPIAGAATYAGIVALGLAAVSVIVRMRSASPVVRRQTRWVVIAGTISAVLLAAAIVMLGLDFVLNAAQPAAATGAASLLLFALGMFGFGTLVPLAIGFAILRHQLWDVSAVLSRAFVYTLLAAIVTLLYAAIVAGLGTLLQSAGDQVLSLVATGVVALAAMALRTRVQGSINRLMYGDRDDPVTLLARLGRKLETANDPASALRETVETVVRTLRVPYAAIELEGQGKEPMSSGSAPPSQTGLVSLPMLSQSERIGRLVVAPRAPDDALDARDMRVLEAIAQQAAGVARAAQLLSALQHSRERLVATREEERRRLRRDLHDDMGPTIAAQTLALDAAADLIASDPAAARLVLTRLKAQANDTLAHVRRIVHDLRPPALDELGLAGALRALFEQQISSRTPSVHVEATDPLPALPAAIEAAAYRIAAEAVANTVRHAQAQACTVTIEAEPGALHLVIQDDGRGLRPGYAAGVGLRSMRERAEEVGGRLRISTPPRGGMRVEAELPIGPETTAA